MEGSQISVSNLKKVHVALCCHLSSPMSPVDFKKNPCPLLILRNVHVPCRYNFKAPVECHYIVLMSPVKFKKWSCRPVDFRGLPPCLGCTSTVSTQCQIRYALTSFREWSVPDSGSPHTI